jgi:ketosteroid isomerase-like protein
MLNLFKLRSFFFLPLALSSTALATEPAGDSLSSLVQAEKNFARMSLAKGIRDSFLANLADDAIVFDPAPVNGVKLYTKRSPSEAQLSWEPIFADVSIAGDIGYTTGPWDYKKRKNDAQPVAYGQFLSIWKRQPDGAWKVVLDGGVDNPAPIEKESPGPIVPNELATKTPVDLKTARKALAEAEKEFDDAAAKNAGDALIAAAADNIRVFRNGRFPAVGRDAAQLMIGYDHGKLTSKRLGGAISRSGDLAYSYGEYSNQRQDGTERGYYVTIWRMSLGGDWKLAVDVRKQQPLSKPATKSD